MKKTRTARKRVLLGLIVALMLTAAGSVLMPHLISFFSSSSLPIRVIISLSLQIIMFAAAIFANNCIEKRRFAELGFTAKNLSKQLLWAGAIFLMLTVYMTVWALFVGLENYIGTEKQPLWFALPQKIIFVGFAEETLFRGYILGAIKRISGSAVAAVILSSLLFGAFHIINGNLIQAVNTSLIGLIFAIPFVKAKNCSLLSVALAHGFYDALLDILR
jgi:membrane protease YdiL (CAAX protease family)